MARCTGIAQRTVVRFKFDPIKRAQFPKTIRFVPGKAPTHSCDGAQLRKTKATLEPFIFITDESVVEIDVVGDEDTGNGRTFAARPIMTRSYSSR